MTKVTYEGPYGSVEPRLPDGTIITVAHGESVDVPQQVADSLSETGEWKKTKAATGGKAS